MSQSRVFNSSDDLVMTLRSLQLDATTRSQMEALATNRMMAGPVRFEKLYELFQSFCDNTVRNTEAVEEVQGQVEYLAVKYESLVSSHESMQRQINELRSTAERQPTREVPSRKVEPRSVVRRPVEPKPSKALEKPTQKYHEIKQTESEGRIAQLVDFNSRLSQNLGNAPDTDLVKFVELYTQASEGLSTLDQMEVALLSTRFEAVLTEQNRRKPLNVESDDLMGQMLLMMPTEQASSIGSRPTVRKPTLMDEIMENKPESTKRHVFFGSSVEIPNVGERSSKPTPSSRPVPSPAPKLSSAPTTTTEKTTFRYNVEFSTFSVGSSLQLAFDKIQLSLDPDENLTGHAVVTKCGQKVHVLKPSRGDLFNRKKYTKQTFGKDFSNVFLDSASNRRLANEAFKSEHYTSKCIAQILGLINLIYSGLDGKDRIERYMEASTLVPAVKLLKKFFPASPNTVVGYSQNHGTTYVMTVKGLFEMADLIENLDISYLNDEFVYEPQDEQDDADEDADRYKQDCEY